jgi:hypothetical protein
MRRLAGALESAESPVVIERSLCKLLLAGGSEQRPIFFADTRIGNA